MGTRCNIVLKCGDQTKYIYRHYDGYPSSVLPDIKKYAEAVRWYADNYTTFCQELAGSKAKAGAETLQNDPKLLLGLYADVLVKHKAWDEMLQTLLVAPKVRDAHTHYEPMQLTGKYETTNSLHGDIDYCYHITIDELNHLVNTVTYFKVANEGSWSAPHHVLRGQFG